MNMTPEDIAEQRHHRDIVKLLTDLSLGCNSPNAVPAPTLLPEGQKSPMVSIASLLATSPPAAEIPMVARQPWNKNSTRRVKRPQ